MTKYEKLDYLQKYVASQGTQAGLSIAPLLQSIIEENEDIFDVQVEDDQVNAMVELTGGKYLLTLSKTQGNSQLVFTPNA